MVFRIYSNTICVKQQVALQIRNTGTTFLGNKRSINRSWRVGCKGDTAVLSKIPVAAFSQLRMEYLGKDYKNEGI